jgi:hypothetical protein
MTTNSVKHHVDWPSGFYVAGGISPGALSGQVVACLKNSTNANASLVVMDATTGVQSSSWDAGASFCGPFKADRDGKRIFAVKQSGGKSVLYALNADLTEISHVSPGFEVSAIEMINE